MTPIAISLLTFVLTLVGMSLGIFMQRVLPEGHLSSDSKEVVKLSMGVVATLAALVLGLLVASAKSSYDARESEINQITASVILSITCLPNMEREPKPRARRCAKQFQQWSIEFGERPNPYHCRRRHSTLPLRARPSISRFRTFNQPTIYNADCRRGSFRSPTI